MSSHFLRWWMPIFCNLFRVKVGIFHTFPKFHRNPLNLLGEIRQSSSARPVWTATVRWWRSSTPRSAASPVRPASWRQRWWKHIEVRLPNGAKMGKDRIGHFMGYNLTIPTRIWKNMIFGSGWKYGVYMQYHAIMHIPRIACKKNSSMGTMMINHWILGYPWVLLFFSDAPIPACLKKPYDPRDMIWLWRLPYKNHQNMTNLM
jgi:hypothetical protein